MLNFHAKTEDFGLTHTVFKAFVQLAYGLITNNQVVLLSVSKSLAYAMGGKKITTPSIRACKRKKKRKEKKRHLIKHSQHWKAVVSKMYC